MREGLHLGSQPSKELIMQLMGNHGLIYDHVQGVHESPSKGSRKILVAGREVQVSHQAHNRPPAGATMGSTCGDRMDLGLVVRSASVPKWFRGGYLELSPIQARATSRQNVGK